MVIKSVRVNGSKLNVIGYKTHNSKKFFVDEAKNNNCNTNFNSNCKEKLMKSKINKIKNKNVILHYKKENKNEKKYNIEEIIKKRGLGKNIREKNKMSQF